MNLQTDEVIVIPRSKIRLVGVVGILQIISPSDDGVEKVIDGIVWLSDRCVGQKQRIPSSPFRMRASGDLPELVPDQGASETRLQGIEAVRLLCREMENRSRG